jgi:hypothetical protein
MQSQGVQTRFGRFLALVLFSSQYPDGVAAVSETCRHCRFTLDIEWSNSAQLQTAAGPLCVGAVLTRLQHDRRGTPALRQTKVFQYGDPLLCNFAEPGGRWM